jgi:hypothetical protein
MMFKIFAIILSTVSLISCGGSSDANNNVGTTNTDSGWSIDTSFIKDSGAGKDGLPSLDQPNFQRVDETTYIFSTDLIMEIKTGDKIKGFLKYFRVA